MILYVWVDIDTLAVDILHIYRQFMGRRPAGQGKAGPHFGKPSQTVAN
jgi:hypothetical protein